MDKIHIAIIVPFRDIHSEQMRTVHLNRFIKEMPLLFETFLMNVDDKDKYDYKILIIEQNNYDTLKFNRGKLLNIGFKIAKQLDCNIFIFHDVDLLPSMNLVMNAYFKYPTNPMHIAKIWNRYSSNPKYFGGIVSMNELDFVKINGFPNNFWGWGGEDDEMYLRLRANNLMFDVPKEGNIIDMEDMDIGQKLGFLKEHTNWKCLNKTELLKEHNETWKENGLNQTTYKTLKIKNYIPVTKCYKITVEIGLNGHWSDGKSDINDVSYGK